MSHSITGKIKLIGDVQTFASGFSKRELVITTDDQYPQDIVVEALKEKAEMLDPLKVGETVTAHFDIRGREYNGRHFVNLTLWKIDAGSGGGKKPKATEPEPEDTTDYGDSDAVDVEPPF